MGRPRSRPRGQTEFAQYLWPLIDGGELTEAEIAAETGVHVKTVLEWLAGIGPRTGEKAYRIAIDRALARRRRVTEAEFAAFSESAAGYGREQTEQLVELRKDITQGFERLASLFERFIGARDSRVDTGPD